VKDPIDGAPYRVDGTTQDAEQQTTRVCRLLPIFLARWNLEMELNWFEELKARDPR
jgi:hypothetical protein